MPFRDLCEGRGACAMMKEAGRYGVGLVTALVSVCVVWTACAFPQYFAHVLDVRQSNLPILILLILIVCFWWGEWGGGDASLTFVISLRVDYSFSKLTRCFRLCFVYPCIPWSMVYSFSFFPHVGLIPRLMARDVDPPQQYHHCYPLHQIKLSLLLLRPRGQQKHKMEHEGKDGNNQRRKKAPLEVGGVCQKQTHQIC